jgi:WD40 repeat protein
LLGNWRIRFLRDHLGLRRVKTKAKNVARRSIRRGFSPDDAILACGSKDGTVRFRSELVSNSPFAYSWRSVLAVAFSADGKLIATGAEDGTAKIWKFGPAL